MSIAYINCPRCNYQFSFNDSVSVLHCPMCGQMFAFSVEPTPPVVMNNSEFFNVGSPLTTDVDAKDVVEIIASESDESESVNS